MLARFSVLTNSFGYFFNRVKILPLGIHEIIAGLTASGIAYFAAGALSKEEPDTEMIKKCF